MLPLKLQGLHRLLFSECPEFPVLQAYLAVKVRVLPVKEQVQVLFPFLRQLTPEVLVPL